jgi:Spy/CpxP family protein refolding chaperone
MTMKHTKSFTLILLTGLMMISTASMAQRGRSMREPGRMTKPPGWNQSCQGIPNLTDQQQEQIQGLRVDHMKEMTDFRNQLNEKRARLRTLETKDDPNMETINQVIEEMGAIRINMQKNTATHRQEVRKLLSEEQKAYYDSRMMRCGRFDGRGGRPGGRGMNRPGRW